MAPACCSGQVGLMSRRQFLQGMGGAALLAACGTLRAPARHGIRAIAFDLFTLFDPRGVDRRVAELLGEDSALAATWKTRLFEYCWIRAASGQYVNFEALVHDALVYAARAHDLEMSAEVQRQLEAVFTELSPWPDTVAVLRELRGRGLRLAPLANYAPPMIEALLAHAGMRDLFEALISTDAAQTYKPDPRAYALGEATFGLPRQQIAFAAFGGWGAAGARWFGYPTFWVNRLGLAHEELLEPDASGSDLGQLASWVARAQPTP
jgi:2-haloacid dehalogenase